MFLPFFSAFPFTSSLPFSNFIHCRKDERHARHSHARQVLGNAKGAFYQPSNRENIRNLRRHILKQHGNYEYISSSEDSSDTSIGYHSRVSRKRRNRGSSSSKSSKSHRKKLKELTVPQHHSIANALLNNDKMSEITTTQAINDTQSTMPKSPNLL